MCAKRVSKTLIMVQLMNFETIITAKTLPGPTQKTFSKSAQIHICLYSCGDWARYALFLKYDTVNTLAPPSLAAEIETLMLLQSIVSLSMHTSKIVYTFD